MSKIAVVTDSNSGITPLEAAELNVSVIPMPFMIDRKTYYENIDLNQEQFYEKLEGDADIITSQPTPASVLELWDELLKEYDEIVHIPMSSGLSGSCQSAYMLAQDYDGKVQVVNNQRISITQKQSVKDALMLIEKGYDAAQIKEILEEDKFNSSIYIMLDTLKYLKKGGRITPAVALLAGLLKIVPVMKLNYELGGKIDSLDKVRTVKKANLKIIQHMVEECHVNSKDYVFAIEHVLSQDLALEMKQKLIDTIGECDVIVRELPAVVGAHMGVGGIGYQYIKKYEG